MTENSVAISTGARLLALLEVGGVFVGLLVASLLIALAAMPLLPESLATPVSALGMWGAVLVGHFFLRRSGSSYRQLGLRAPESWPRTLAWAAAGVAISMLGAGVIGAAIKSLTDWPPADIGFIRSSIGGNLPVYLAWMLLVVWGSAAFGEELLARGFIMDRLERVFGGGRAAAVPAAFGQAAIFGALHGIQGPSGMLVTFYVGLVFAWIYFAVGRNLWPVILAHGVIDSISITMLYMEVPLPGHIG